MRRKGGRGMSEWKKVKLGEVCDTQYGFTASTVQQDTGTQFLRITDIVPQLIDWNTVPYCQIQEKDREKYLLHKGDIVVARTGATVGYAKYIKEDVPAVFASYLVRLLVNSIDVDRHYVGLCVESNLFKEYIQSISNGSAQPNANAQMISSFEINLPPLSTQHRIATILSRYDSLIENYQKQIKLLEEAAQRLYKEWFVDLHFPGHENTKIVDGVPEGWEKKKVNSIIELQSGFAFKSSTFDDNGAYKIVTIKNVKDGAFDGDNVSRIVAIPEKMPKHCVLADGDILLSLTGNVGRVCIVNGKNYLLNQRVAKLATDYKAFTYCLFRSRDMFIEVNNLANGAAQQNVSPIRIGEMKILLPNNELLQEFESIARKSIARILSLQSQLRLLTEARDRLLPKLMNGEIAV